MGKYIPKIQDALRKIGFPRFQKSAIHEFQLSKTAPPEPSSVDRYEFQDKTATSGVVITPYAMSLHTCDYSNYENFEAKLRRVLTEVQNVLDISLIERVGLRYVDLLKPDAGESLADYVKPGLLGLDLSQLDVEEVQSQFTVSGKSDLGTLVARMFRMKGRFLPPDLESTLNLQVRLANFRLEPKEVVAVLDFDHYSEETGEFETELALESVGKLHDKLDQAFRLAVTEHALAKWGDNENGA